MRLTHYRAKGDAQFARFLGCEVEFGATRDEILFSRETGQLRMSQGGSVPQPHAGRHVRAGTGAPAARGGLVRGARRECARAAVAAWQGARRESCRRVRHEPAHFRAPSRGRGPTFSRLLDRLRLDLARRYLLNEELPISKVAWLLGYKEVGAFSHAFRRWTGKSPSEVAQHGG